MKLGLMSSHTNMNVSPFAQIFFAPNPFAQNAIRPGSVRPPVLNVQGLFVLILSILWPRIHV